MIDAKIRGLCDPALEAIARTISPFGIKPDQLSLFGFLIGMSAIPVLWSGWFHLALVLLLLNRMIDGVDGTLARQIGATQAGAYLDICLDFVFYSAFVLGFCLAIPDQAIYGALLIFAFVANGSSFLAFAIYADRLGMQSRTQKKSFYHLEGLAEGFETILVFILMCLFPTWFWLLAFCFAVMCLISAAARIYSSYHLIRNSLD